MKEGGGEEGERERERALGVCVGGATTPPPLLAALDIEVDPQRRRFCRRESDFALQTEALVECRAPRLASETARET